jgi:hypothetical protein
VQQHRWGAGASWAERERPTLGTEGIHSSDPQSGWLVFWRGSESVGLCDLPGRSGSTSFFRQSMPLPALTVAKELLEALESRNCDRFAQEEL